MSLMSKANIEQWNEAAGAFAKEQEQSAFSDMNKAVVKERFRELLRVKFQEKFPKTVW